VPNAFEAQPEEILIVLAAVCGILIVLVIGHWLRRRRPSPQGPVLSIDDALRSELADIRRRLEMLERGMAQVTTHLPKAIQGVGVVRYNPFPDMGGNMSFSLALLDAQANGVVVSVLNNRDSARVYGKPIEAGRSNHPLSAEELQALAVARGRRPEDAR
jgi:hypothetical protein